MKKIVVAVAAVAVFSFSASAQEAKPAQQQPSAQHHEQHEKKDEFVMKDGKLTQRVNGQESVVEKDVTLKNGTVVMANGTVKHADGKTTTLKDGDCVSMEGKVWNKKEAHENKVMKGEMNK
jgi:D-lyxose ketol-isomerase